MNAAKNPTKTRIKYVGLIKDFVLSFHLKPDLQKKLHAYANTMSKYTDETEARRDEIYRSMSGEQKLRIAYELYLFARHVVESSIREYFPDISSDELQKKMIERFYR